MKKTSIVTIEPMVQSQETRALIVRQLGAALAAKWKQNAKEDSQPRMSADMKAGATTVSSAPSPRV